MESIEGPILDIAFEHYACMFIDFLFNDIYFYSSEIIRIKFELKVILFKKIFCIKLDISVVFSSSPQMQPQMVVQSNDEVMSMPTVVPQNGHSIQEPKAENHTVSIYFYNFEEGSTCNRIFKFI